MCFSGEIILLYIYRIYEYTHILYPHNMKFLQLYINRKVNIVVFLYIYNRSVNNMNAESHLKRAEEIKKSIDILRSKGGDIGSIV